MKTRILVSEIKCIVGEIVFYWLFSLNTGLKEHFMDTYLCIDSKIEILEEILPLDILDLSFIDY